MDSTVAKHFANGHIAKLTPEGFVLASWTIGMGEGSPCAVGFWILVSLTIFVTRGFVSIVWLVLFLLFSVVVFVLLTLIFRRIELLHMWRDFKLFPAELILPAYPLHLGETMPIYYRRRLRRGRLSQSIQIEAALVCDEWVQYSEGTDTITKTHPLSQTELPSASIDSGENQIEYQSNIYIDPQQPPSFFGKHNQIRWSLNLKFKMPGILGVCQSNFSLQILPETVSLGKI